MPSLTTDQIKAKKDLLDNKLLELCKAFEAATGVYISYVNVSREEVIDPENTSDDVSYTMGYRGGSLREVKTDIHLKY